MQKISQVHSCIWKLQSSMYIFYHNHPEIIKVVLNFLEFTSACTKSAQSTHPFIHSPCDQCATTISDHTNPNIFLSTLNFWVSICKKVQTISSLCSRYIFDLKSFNLIGWPVQIWPYMNEKQLTDLLILHLAMKMIEKVEKTKIGFQS